MALHNNINISEAIGILAALSLTYFILNAVYNVYFHPLRNFPGPLLMRASRLPYVRVNTRGRLPHTILELHEKYGEVVRIAPNELSFANPAAWNDIQGHRTKGQPEMEKAPQFYKPIGGVQTDVVTADREEHSKLRRTLAHGFSERALRDQEPLITKYIDLLLRRLRDNCNGGVHPLDMTAWYNFTTFDIIGDLAFGEPFGCLEESRYHPWVSTIFQLAYIGTFVQGLAYFPTLKAALELLVPFAERMNKYRQDFLDLSKVKLRTRMENFKDRPDLVESMLKRKDEWVMGFPNGLTMEKLQANASLLIIAGSETTATFLSGVTYLLSTNPTVMKKAAEEVRSTFKSEADINFVTTNDLTYMNACISEAFRCYPPVAQAGPRVVPSEGGQICGYFVPKDTLVGINQYATYHLESLFKDPYEYHPERFLGDPRYVDDSRDMLQPFHVGPRNCLGRNLAYVEIRTIMARILLNFDLHIADESRDWIDQKNFNFWKKSALKVHLTPVAR
ncbi:cytochrome P450 [Xylariales sp. PMI_506]|nr:cytochrome P450 [Xylariales sp. PMI_506]